MRGGGVTILVSMSRSSIHYFKRFQADSSPPRTINQRRVILGRDAPAHKPAMDCDEFKRRVSGQSVLIDVSAAVPTPKDLPNGVICYHDRHFMTKSVIRQRCQHGY